MAGETTFSDDVSVAAFVENGIAEYLHANSVMLALVNKIPFVRGSDSVKQRQKGSFTATTATEATDHATSQYTRTALPTLQVQEVKVYAELSYKARDYSTITPQEMAEEAGKAVLKKLEQDILGLADGFSTTVGATGVDVTPAVLKSSFYELEANDVPGRYVHVGHPRSLHDVTDDLIDATAGAASFWANPNASLSILNGNAPQMNGYKGEYLGVDIFSTTNTESVNVGADWANLTCNPQLAISFGEDGRGIIVEIDRDIKKGVVQIAVFSFYDTKERIDGAGVYVVGDQ